MMMRPTYDEPRVMEVLSSLSPRARSAFACVSAEVLLPSYKYLWPERDSLDFHEVAIGVSWSWIFEGERPMASQVEQLEYNLLAQYPDDEDDVGYFRSAVGQSATGAALYALRVAVADEVQDAVWGGRQLFDAAYSVYGGPYEDREASAICQFAFGALNSAIEDVSNSERYDELRVRSIALGLEFRDLAISAMKLDPARRSNLKNSEPSPQS